MSFLFLFLFVDGFYVSSDLLSRFFYLFSITQLHFKCSGSSQPPPSTHDKHVDPHTGVHLEEVTATIHRDLVDEYFGKGPFKCECHAWSSRGVVKSQAATVNIACKLQILSFKNVIQSNQSRKDMNEHDYLNVLMRKCVCLNLDGIHVSVSFVILSSRLFVRLSVCPSVRLSVRPNYPFCF